MQMEFAKNPTKIKFHLKFFCSIIFVLRLLALCARPKTPTKFVFLSIAISNNYRRVLAGKSVVPAPSVVVTTLVNL
jgi:hypothetical protein